MLLRLVRVLARLFGLTLLLCRLRGVLSKLTRCPEWIHVDCEGGTGGVSGTVHEQK